MLEHTKSKNVKTCTVSIFLGGWYLSVLVCVRIYLFIHACFLKVCVQTIYKYIYVMWRHVKIVSTRSVRTITTYCMDICLPNYLETKWSLQDMFIGQPLILRFEEVVSNITPALWQSNMGKSWKITKYSDMFPIQTSVFLHTHVCIYIYTHAWYFWDFAIFDSWQPVFRPFFSP